MHIMLTTKLTVYTVYLGANTAYNSDLSAYICVVFLWLSYVCSRSCSFEILSTKRPHKLWFAALGESFVADTTVWVEVGCKINIINFKHQWTLKAYIMNRKFSGYGCEGGKHKSADDIFVKRTFYGFFTIFSAWYITYLMYVMHSVYVVYIMQKKFKIILEFR